MRTWAGLMARSIRAAGGRAGDRVHVAYGYGLFTGGPGAHYGAEELGCTTSSPPGAALPVPARPAGPAGRPDRPDATPADTPADADAAGREPAGLVKNMIGVSVAVDVMAPDGVERSMGKMRRIVDRRPKG